jgi:hypothetical protein
MDNKTDLDHLIDAEYLHNPEFMLGLWYAQKTHIALGLACDAPMEEPFCAELGDALMNGAHHLPLPPHLIHCPQQSAAWA